MQPLFLQLKDFMLHGESTIDFTKLSPASVIIGMEDNNLKNSIGVGKTTIFHAIRYALYNAKPSTNINKIIRDGAKKTEVIFEFSMNDGNVYRIERTRTKTTQNVYLKIKYNDGWKELTDRTNSLTDEKILSIIKINQDTFENSSYFKQKDQFNIASVSSTKRKEIIREMLKLEEWLKYEKKAKAIRDEYDKKLSVLKLTIDNLGEPQSDIFLINKQLEELEEDIIKNNNSINNISSTLDSKKSELEELKRNLSLEYPQLLKKIKNDTDYLNKLNNDIKVLQYDKSKYNSIISLLSNKIDSSTKEIDDKTKFLNDLSSNIPEQINQEEYEKVSDDIIKLSSLIKQNEILYKNTSKPLPDDDYCPTCNTELNEQHRDKLLSIKKEKLDSLLNDINNYKNKYKKLESIKNDMDSSIKEYNKIKTKISATKEELKYKDNSLKSDVDTLNQKQKMILSIDEEISSKKEHIQQTEQSIKDLNSAVEAIDNKSNEKLIAKINSEIASINSSLIKERQEGSTLIFKKGKLNTNLESRRNDLVKLNENIQLKLDIEYKLNVYKTVVNIFGSSGIPALIIHSVLDSLQNETNKVLDVLIPGIQIQFYIQKEKSDGSQDEVLDMKFFINGKECDFLDLSGGQQESVILALKFAICVINRNRCGADIKMLLLDEVDQGLDQKTIDSFYNVLKKWSNDMMILVITHNTQLKEKFNSFILVEKNNGISSAKVIN